MSTFLNNNNNFINIIISLGISDKNTDTAPWSLKVFHINASD